MPSMSGVFALAFVLALSLPQASAQKNEALGQPGLVFYNPEPVPDPDPQLVPESSPRFKRGVLQCPCSPTDRGGSLPGWMDEVRKALNGFPELKGLKRIQDKMAEFPQAFKATHRTLAQCLKKQRMEGCVNADAALRGKVEPVLCSWDRETSRNVYNGSTVGSCGNDARFNLTAGQINEGCVAVEHLEGYVLQHAQHLMRPVLCAHEFCATPNHAIIVGGEYTSMKRLCGNTWKCSQHVMLVNNLKVTANRRARVSEHIVVTPYDIRFPKVAVWVVQIVEGLWNGWTGHCSAEVLQESSS